MSNPYNPTFNKLGYIQVYTGDGKGKTTAAIGLCARALGQNFKVLIQQFCKNKDNSGEYKCLARPDKDLAPNKNLTYRTCGIRKFPLRTTITEADRIATKESWDFILKNCKDYDLIVLDELNIALELGLLHLDEVMEFLKSKPENLEIVITGRHACPEIVGIAHLVSEVKLIKHYWDIGVKARSGIEYILPLMFLSNYAIGV